MASSSGISVAVQSCDANCANCFLSHGVATLFLQVRGQVNLPRHGYTAVSFVNHSSAHQDSSVAMYFFRFSVMLVSDCSLPSDQAAVTAITHPHLITLLGDPTSAIIFPITTVSSPSSSMCHALVSRVTKAQNGSFPFFGKHWSSSSTRSLSAILSTCPVADGARVIVYSSAASNFYELVVSVDSALHGGEPGVQASFLAACTHSNVHVDIASSVKRIEPDSKVLNVTVASCNAQFSYVDVPESKLAADVVISCWVSRHLTSSFILLHGPPGCGKTACIKHILSQNFIPHEYFDCSALYQHEGASFSAAVNSVALQIKRGLLHISSSDVGAVLVLDRIECMFPHLSPHAQLHERREVSFCLAVIDNLINSGDVVIVGITSALTSVDPHILHVGSPSFDFVFAVTLAQPGRINHVVAMPLLSPASRQIVLRHVLSFLLPMSLFEELGHMLIRVASESSPGFSIADVIALGCSIAKKVHSPCMSMVSAADSLSDIAGSLSSLTLADTTDRMQVIVASAVAQTRPSILRSLSSSGALPRCSPPVCAGMDTQLSEISAVLRSVFDQECTQVQSHLRRCSGLLLCGPSGCGKSVVARWIAASLANSANFITLESPAILSAVIGDSEKALSSAFERARASAPSVLFIDKLEILGRVRGQDSTTEGTYDRLLATLLIEMDGVKQVATGCHNRQPVFFLASTEDAADVDGALMRPGRFEHILVMKPPDVQQRAQVFHANLERMAYNGDLEQDSHCFAQMSEGWSMARISSACVAAALSALRINPNAVFFSSTHVIAELCSVQPS